LDAQEFSVQIDLLCKKQTQQLLSMNMNLTYKTYYLL
jgi:hypothetical protein